MNLKTFRQRCHSNKTLHQNLKGLKSLSMALAYLASGNVNLLPNDKRITNISLLLKNTKTLPTLKLDLEGTMNYLNELIIFPGF